ncbi:MAG: sugar-binding domain-containing protein [Verrucomicrobiae bacterium]
MDDGWRFFAAQNVGIAEANDGDKEPEGAQEINFDDSAWRVVDLPHDWSIEGKLCPKAPMGGNGGFFLAGVGWYRRHLNVPIKWDGQRVRIEFEGVYMNAEIYCNGQKLAFHPYGYTSFFVDLTPALNRSGDNVLAVRVDNSRHKNSRWYSGSGIYRHVWLTVENPVHVLPWGVFASVSQADAQSAVLEVETELVNESPADASVTVQTEVFAPDGRSIGKAETPCELKFSKTNKVAQTLMIKNPALWSPEKPQLSRAVTRVVAGGKAVDEVSTPFGFRTLAWSAEKGFTINGAPYKLNGGCIHHDNGVLGACAFDRAEERKIERLKAAGFNAIRTAHNPPSPALLEASDRLGMLVLDEAFDCWALGKNLMDYHVAFMDWWERDLDSIVSRDRNHPSVVMWSIGNEIPGRFTAMGAEYGPKLAERIRARDKTRPVSNGICGWPINKQHPKPDDAQSLANAETNYNSLDIVGGNYDIFNWHISQHANHPQRVLVSTESYPPLGKWKQIFENSFCVGDFVWTAQDYLGESGAGRCFYEDDPAEAGQVLVESEQVSKPGKKKPTGPVPRYPGAKDEVFPWHGTCCGLLDLTGAEKAVNDLRRMAWGSGPEVAMAVRLPEQPGHRMVVYQSWGWHPTRKCWTWPGWEGKNIQVEVYSRHSKTRLYQDGKLVGEEEAGEKSGFKSTYPIIYRPGTLRAVSVENGREIGEALLATVGQPAFIRLEPDRQAIHADGQDLSFVNVEVVDKEGNVAPHDARSIKVEIEGEGVIAGIGNADLRATDSYRGNSFHAYEGRMLVVVRAGRKPGKITLKAAADGLPSATVQLQMQ